MEKFGRAIGGVDKSSVSLWERGRNKPNMSNLKKIAELGGTSVEWLLYGKIDEYVHDFIEYHQIELTEDKIYILIESLKRINGEQSENYKLVQPMIEILYPEAVSEAETSDAISSLTYQYDVLHTEEFKRNILPLVQKIYEIDKNEFKGIKNKLLQQLEVT